VPIWKPESGAAANRAPTSPAIGIATLGVALLLLALIGVAQGENDGADSVPQLDVFGFTLRITDADGVITHVLQGERMRQFDQIGQQRADMPRLELLTEGELDWIWSAPAAVHYPAEHRLELLGTTEGLRMPSLRNLQTQIVSADVTILTETREIFSDARTTMIRPDLFMTGIGMYADAFAEIIELKSEVTTVYAPMESEEHPQ
jgi:lipopolysaccharide export system protein LptC